MLSQQSLRVWRQDKNEGGEKRTYLALHPHVDQNTDGENRKSDSLQAFINLMRHSKKNELADSEILPAGSIQKKLHSYKEKL